MTAETALTWLLTRDIVQPGKTCLTHSPEEWLNNSFFGGFV
jgi:hypothetical protein